MFCPICRSEYRAGFTECLDCGGIALVAELGPVTEPEPPSGPEWQKLVEVYRSAHPDSEAIREVLEGSGIPATLDNNLGGQYPVTVGTMGEAGVYVREHDAEAALETIRAAQSGQLTIDENEEQANSVGEAPGTGRRLR